MKHRRDRRWANGRGRRRRSCYYWKGDETEEEEADSYVAPVSVQISC
jgi:hypothetical protein